MLDLPTLGAFVLVGALWGCTNPLLNRASQSRPYTPHPHRGWNFVREVGHLLSNWRFVLPFALNQLGSVAYVATLGSSAISMAQPICNSLSVLFNCLTARALGEKPLNACASLSGEVLCQVDV